MRGKDENDESDAIRIAKEYDLRHVALQGSEIPRELARRIPRDWCERSVAIPIEEGEGTIVLAMADPSNIFAIDDVATLTARRVEVVVATEAEIRDAILDLYSFG